MELSGLGGRGKAAMRLVSSFVVISLAGCSVLPASSPDAPSRTLAARDETKAAASHTVNFHEAKAVAADVLCTVETYECLADTEAQCRGLVYAFANDCYRGVGQQELEHAVGREIGQCVGEKLDAYTSNTAQDRPKCLAVSTAYVSLDTVRATMRMGVADACIAAARKNHKPDVEPLCECVAEHYIATFDDEELKAHILAGELGKSAQSTPALGAALGEALRVCRTER